jgi:hypothetical protein
VISLRIGNNFTGISVHEDEKYPGMWRVHSANGVVSDMVNPSRAKDAAIAWARPHGLGGTEKVYWTPSGNAPGRSLMRKN